MTLPGFDDWLDNYGNPGIEEDNYGNPGIEEEEITMINVTIATNGNVVIKCSKPKCKFSAIIKASWAESPMWELFNGQALLMALGHVEKEHRARVVRA